MKWERFRRPYEPGNGKKEFVDAQRQCDGMWEALCDCADGAASGAVKAAVEAHVRACPSCERDYRLLLHISQTLPSLPDPVPPSGLRRSILESNVRRPQRSFTWRHAPQLAMAAAAVSLVFAVRTIDPPSLAIRGGARITAGQNKAASQPPQNMRVGLTDVADATAREKRIRVPVQFARFEAPRDGSLNPPAERKLPTPIAASSIAPAVAVSRSPHLPVTSTVTRIDVPDAEKATAVQSHAEEELRIARSEIDPPASELPGREPVRVARAEERPIPPPMPEVSEMRAGGMGESASYTLEAKASMDPGTVASLADLKRALHKETEDDSLPPGTFRMNDRREVRLSVHTSRF